MKKEIKQQENATVNLALDFDRNEVDKVRRPLFRSYQNRLNINGFRKGHVSYQMAEKILGKGFLDPELLQELVKENLDNALDELNIKIESKAQLKDYSFDDNGNLSLELEFATSPEIHINDLSKLIEDSEGLENFEMSDELKDKLFKDRKEGLLIELSEKTQTKQPVENGNLVSVKITGLTKEKAYPENYSLIIGEDDCYFPTEIQEQLIGKSIGDQIEIIPDEEKITAEIVDIQNITKPEYNEEFVFNNFFFDSLDDFEEFLRNQAQNEYITKLVYSNGEKQFNKILEKTDIIFSPLYLEEIKKGINPDLIELLNSTNKKFNSTEDKVEAYLDYQKRNELVMYLTNIGLVNPTNQDRVEFLQLKNLSTKKLNLPEQSQERQYVESSDLLHNEVIKSLGTINYLVENEKTKEEEIDA